MYIIYNRVCLLLMCALKLYSKIGLRVNVLGQKSMVGVRSEWFDLAVNRWC